MRYESPKIEIILLNEADVVTTSFTPGFNDDDNINWI